MPTLYNFAKRENIILKQLAKDLESLLSLEAIQKLVTETGFSKRPNKFQAAPALHSMLRVISSDKEWNQYSLWDGYCTDMENKAVKQNKPIDSYTIQPEVFNDHLKKDAFLQLAQGLRQSLADACLNGSLREYDELVEVIKTRTGIDGIAIADGTEVHVAESMSAIFKGPHDGQLKIHKLLDVKSATPLSEKITSGVASERDALIESFDKVKGKKLAIADAGYLGGKLFSHLIGTGKKFLIKLKSDSALPVIAWQKIYKNNYKPSAAKISPRNKRDEPIYHLNDKNVFKDGESYDTVVKGSKGAVYRVVKVWLKDSDNKYKHVLFATNISPKELDGFQIAELYRARWAIELSFRCDKGFNSTKAGRTRTKSIIEAFIALTQCLGLIKMMIAQAMEKIIEVTLSLKRLAHYSNKIVRRLCKKIIKGKSVRDFLETNVSSYTRMKKTKPSKVNRERGKDLALVIDVLRQKPRPTTLTATWHQYYDAAAENLMAKYRSQQLKAA